MPKPIAQTLVFAAERGLDVSAILTPAFAGDRMEKLEACSNLIQRVLNNGSSVRIVVCTKTMMRKMGSGLREMIFVNPDLLDIKIASEDPLHGPPTPFVCAHTIAGGAISAGKPGFQMELLSNGTLLMGGDVAQNHLEAFERRFHDPNYCQRPRLTAFSQDEFVSVRPL